MAIERPADARPADYAFRGFNALIGHKVEFWRPGFVEMSLEVRPELCNASGIVHGGVLMTLLDSASGVACTFDEKAGTRRYSVTLAFTTQFLKAARSGDRLRILGAKRESPGRTTFFAETEILDGSGALIATGSGTFRYRAGERADGSLRLGAD
ncbi:MAG: PaaI family thioesterase [Alphaproteobacteria bacterium]|nr:PaaI family thioesterase [Alphaproteobacteria bacterium]